MYIGKVGIKIFLLFREHHLIQIASKRGCRPELLRVGTDGDHASCRINKGTAQHALH